MHKNPENTFQRFLSDLFYGRKSALAKTVLPQYRRKQRLHVISSYGISTAAILTFTLSTCFLFDCLQVQPRQIGPIQLVSRLFFFSRSSLKVEVRKKSIERQEWESLTQSSEVKLDTIAKIPSLRNFWASPEKKSETICIRLRQQTSANFSFLSAALNISLKG